MQENRKNCCLSELLQSALERLIFPKTAGVSNSVGLATESPETFELFLRELSDLPGTARQGTPALAGSARECVAKEVLAHAFRHSQNG
jgi:hypothetical protein